jgi:hypothetical protein
MPDDKKIIEPIDADFHAVAKAMLQSQLPKGITPKASGISVLAGKSGSKEISSYEPELDFGIET